MSYVDFKPVPLPKFGGLFTFLKPVDVPSGYSPALQNVRFLPRAFFSRPGIIARMTKANRTFQGMSQYISNSGSKLLVTEDDQGNLDFQDTATGNPDPLMGLANVANGPAFEPGSLLTSKTAFGRIFLAGFNTDLSPAGLIRYWNGIRQQVNPSSSPTITVVDSATSDSAWQGSAGNYQVQILFEHIDGSFSIASQAATWVSAGGKQPAVSSIPVGAANLNVVARWVTFSLQGVSAPLFRLPSGRLADNVSTSFNVPGPGASNTIMESVGARTDQLITNLINPPPLPHISPDGPAGAPVPSDSANAGSVALGVHQVWVSFETLFGYITSPSPAGSWTAAGGKKALVNTIPIGPWYVTARRVFFSSSGGQDALFLSTFRIPNNTTQSIEVDFTDTNLLQGTNVNYLFKNFAIPPSLGVASYGGRLCTWGALNTLKATQGVNNSSVMNLGFDGGWNASTGAPLGWTLDASAGLFGDKEVFNAWAGDAWTFVGDNVHGNIGMINNSQLATNGSLSVLTPYTVKFWARLIGTINGANSMNVELFSPSIGSLGLVSISASQMSGTWTKFSGQLTSGLASIPSDLVLRVYGGGLLATTTRMWIDDIRIFPTNSPVENSTLRIGNPFDTETFDGTNGFQLIAKDNGENIAAVVQLRSFLYVLKERSMHVTYDDTINPPSLWLNRQIDSTIGTANPRSLVSSDTFIVFAARGGAYMFTGSRPQKCSQEIQTTWEGSLDRKILGINWTLSSTVHTVMDTENKLVYFFVPLTTDTAPKNCLILDYSEGLGNEDDPGPRKWAKDQYLFAINGSLKFENSVSTQTLSASTSFPVKSNTQSIYLCGPKVYEFGGPDDDGQAIDWFYETAYVKAGDVGQDMFGGVQYYAEGSGTLLVTMKGLDDVIIQQIQDPAQTLSAAPGKQFENYANVESERAKIRFEQTADGATATIKGLTVMSQAWAQQRIH